MNVMKFRVAYIFAMELTDLSNILEFFILFKK